MRTCVKCNEDKPESDFYGTKTKIAGGKKYSSSFCKKCDKKRTGERLQQLRKLFVEYKGGKCSICGYGRCIWALELHHRNPNEKEFIISRLRSFNEKTKKELDKCDLLCANCHREIHFNQIF